MTRAVVKVFSSAAEAAEEVDTLAGPGVAWSVAYSGPDDGVDFMDGDQTLASSDKRWVVIAARSGLTIG